MSNHSFGNDVIEEKMGLMMSYRWIHDPKTVLFVLARYKFVAKMLHGYTNVLEVGCADGFGSRIVRASVSNLTAIDIDAQMIEDAKKRNSVDKPIYFSNESMGELIDRALFKFDALYALDVLEHVEPEAEGEFMSQAARLASVAIIGMPSLESQSYASPLSKQNHVNCKSEAGLRILMGKHYRRVFMFGMNDETLTTGFGPMCQYRFAIGVNP